MKDVLGIVFADEQHTKIGDLTNRRPLAAVPVAGRYRCIDFVLSDMVNSGMINIAVVTQNNYHSLMDHLGSGKAWNLSRKKYGLYLFPPYSSPYSTGYDNRIDILYSLLSYLKHSSQQYVILSESNLVINATFSKAFAHHLETKADITVLYEQVDPLSNTKENDAFIYTDRDGAVIDIEINANYNESNKRCIGVYILDRIRLIQIIENSFSRGKKGYLMNLISRNIGRLNIQSYQTTAYMKRIADIHDFYHVNMEILNQEVREKLFHADTTIYTKVKDTVPTTYSKHANVKNSFIADGCVIDGTVENCILFRGVKVKKGAVLKNCIILQQSEILSNCHLENVITDKLVLINEGKTLIGTKDFPIVVPKEKVIL